MAEFWASTGAIWRNMLLAEALVLYHRPTVYVLYYRIIWPIQLLGCHSYKKTLVLSCLVHVQGLSYAGWRKWRIVTRG